MNATVDDVMVPTVIVGDEDNTVGEVRELMEEKGIHALPIVSKAGHAIGIVTSSDILGDEPADMPVRELMGSKVHTVPRNDGVHNAARVMRKHRLHHLVVTDEKKVVGILSSFDMLKLVENHRFTMKKPPAASEREGAKRR